MFIIYFGQFFDLFDKIKHQVWCGPSLPSKGRAGVGSLVKTEKVE
jgi:hypothetical protein